MRPEAFIRGPILNIISLVVMSFFVKLVISIIAFNPTQGCLLSCFKPWNVNILFSPQIGTISEATLTATKSSSGFSLLNLIPLFIANPCMNLKPTPQPDRWVYGYVLSNRLGFNMATAGGRTSSGT